MKYLSVKTLIGEIRRDIKFKVSETDIIEWVGRVLDQTQAPKDYDNFVAFSEVKNYECVIPANTKHIIQIARNTCWTGDTETDICPADVVEEEEEQNYVVLDCNGMPLTKYEVRYYTPAWDWKFEYYGWMNHRMYKKCFQPVRLANHSFFNSVVCKEYDENLYSGAKDEYTIIDPNLRFSFKEGFVAISYNKLRLDEDGYPMIPDHTSYVEAVKAYIRLQKANIDLDLGENGALGIKREREADWHWYCKQAANYSKQFRSIDERQDMADQAYMLPDNYKYHTYFETLGRPEARPFRQW